MSVDDSPVSSDGATFSEFLKSKKTSHLVGAVAAKSRVRKGLPFLFAVYRDKPPFDFELVYWSSWANKNTSFVVTEMSADFGEHGVVKCDVDGWTPLNFKKDERYAQEPHYVRLVASDLLDVPCQSATVRVSGYLLGDTKQEHFDETIEIAVRFHRDISIGWFDVLF